MIIERVIHSWAEYCISGAVLFSGFQLDAPDASLSLTGGVNSDNLVKLL